MQFNELIVLLLAIDNFNKDIHYSCYGEAFFSKHLFADKFNFSEYIDLIKEVCLLGNDERPLGSKEYLNRTYAILDRPEEHNDRKNFLFIQNLVIKAITLIESMQGLKKGEENLIGAIAQDLMQYKGLLNLQVED